METSIDEVRLKELLKSALIEVFEERQDFVKEIVREAMEDIALVRAIDEGLLTKTVTRGEVFDILDSSR